MEEAAAEKARLPTVESLTDGSLSRGCLSVNSPELFFGLFRVRVRVNSVTETNIMTEK